MRSNDRRNAKTSELNVDMSVHGWPISWNSGLGAARRDSLSRELQRELPENHALRERGWTPLALLIRDPDWMALKLDDGRFAAVHLTWRVEQDARWPYTIFFDSREELCESDEWE